MNGSSFRAVSLAALFAFVPVFTPAWAQDAQAGLRVYISADMEGVVGVVTSDQLGPAGFEYGRFREFMTREVLAAIDGARSAGATEILVSDSHGNKQNLLLEMLPPDVRVIRGGPRPLGMMEGVQDGFDAAVFIGYHAGATNPAGVRAHTMSSANLTAVRLNGIPMPEGGVNAAIAGHFGVPVVMISGDAAAVEEVRSIVGDIEGAVVKHDLGFHAARTLVPEAAYGLIRERVAVALERLETFEPYRLETPVELEISFKHYRPAEVLELLPGVERVAARTIRFVGDDVVEVARFLKFVTTYTVPLIP